LELIDGEVVCGHEKGVAAFQLLRHRRNEPRAFLYAFDLLELNGTDLRREPIEVRKATLAIPRRARCRWKVSFPDGRWKVSFPDEGGPSPVSIDVAGGGFADQFA
jgi:hypothetical protein